MAINFKHVGTKDFKNKVYGTSENSVIPYGFKTPLRFATDQTSCIFDVNLKIGDQIKDDLRNLLLTNWGERVGRYDFGANLQELTTEIVSQPNFEEEVAIRIKTAVLKWMPFVELEDLTTRTIYEDNRYTGKIGIYVAYSVPRLEINKQVVEVILYII